MNYLISSFINTLCVIYIISKLNEEKPIIKNINFYIVIVSMTAIMLLNFLYVDNYLRIAVCTIFTVFCCTLIFKTSFNAIISSVIVEQIILMFSELIFAIFLIIFTNYNSLSIKGNIIITSIICLISILLINNKKVYNFSKFIMQKISIINKLDKFLILLIFFISINILLLILYGGVNSIDLLITNIFLILLYAYVIFLLINEKNKSIIFGQQNKFLINSLNEYEKMLDYQRVNNHENKNQLLVIKSMIEKKDKKLMDYINEIIKEKREDNEIVYNMAKRIPSGGLQGLIYQKMLLMQEKNIEISLDINNKVRKIDFEKLSAKMNYDICRVVGIIIDNAIEETVKFDKKEREIIISMYIDDDFIIEVSNRIKDDIDINKIYDKGYTSKEKGHGYGLSLLKKIIDENENIINEVEIVNNIFTQVVKIKM